MFATVVALFASLQIVGDSGLPRPRTVVLPAPAFGAVAPPLVPVDTPRPRPRAIEYSDWYATRLTIHRWGSYAMVPLLAAQYSLGQNLMNDARPSPWMRDAHAGVASAIGLLFGANTLTGAWNLWDARADPAGRTRRYVHAATMFIADAGFMWAGATAGDEGDGLERGASRSDSRQHRAIAIGSIAVSAVGSTMMWLWK